THPASMNIDTAQVHDRSFDLCFAVTGDFQATLVFADKTTKRIHHQMIDNHVMFLLCLYGYF
ncbi:MAG: hypothetical protein CUN57_03075, partial [Phototrophicales bacterium]